MKKPNSFTCAFNLGTCFLNSGKFSVIPNIYHVSRSLLWNSYIIAMPFLSHVFKILTIKSVCYCYLIVALICIYHYLMRLNIFSCAYLLLHILFGKCLFKSFGYFF